MAALACVKLGLLLFMGMGQAPATHAPSAQAPAASRLTAQAASQAPVSQTAQVTAPVQPVRASILEDSPAMAQQAPKQQPAKAPAQPESVLTVQQLRERADALDRQEQALKAMEADLNARLARLQELEGVLKGMLAEAKSIKDEKMRHLIDVYTNMKSKQAASVLETLDEGIAVKILAGMKGRQAGEILTFVAPKKAAKLSEELTKLQAGQPLPEAP